MKTTKTTATCRWSRASSTPRSGRPASAPRPESAATAHRPTGTAAVIVGNGPSVDRLPPSFWRRCRRPGRLLIGTNRVLCFESLGGVRWDALVIRDTYRNLWHDQRWGGRYHEQFWKPCGAWKVGPAHGRVTHCDEFIRLEAAWQDRRVTDANGESAVAMNSSVVLMAANWAWLQGAREIFLVGVDYRGGHARMVEPFASAAVGWAGLYDRPVPERIEREFAAAVAAVGRRGGAMWNLSPGTRLQAVPRMEWRLLMKDP